MSDISSIYTTRDNIYNAGPGKKSSKGKNGDVKHTIFKDGKPVAVNTIKVARPEDEEQPKRDNSGKRVIRANGSQTGSRNTVSSETKKKKLSEYLRKAVNTSSTLWSEKKGILISYQGDQGFLVKQFTPTDRLISKELLSQEEILNSSIPGIFDTSWKSM